MYLSQDVLLGLSIENQFLSATNVVALILAGFEKLHVIQFLILIPQLKNEVQGLDSCC